METGTQHPDLKKESHPAVKVLKTISAIHGQIWDQAEEMMSEFKNVMSFRVEENKTGAWQAIMTLAGEDVITLRRPYSDKTGAIEYGENYLNRIRNLAPGEGE